MSFIVDIVSLANGCFVDGSDGRDSRPALDVKRTEHEDFAFCKNLRCDSSVSLSPQPLSCMLEDDRDIRFDSSIELSPSFSCMHGVSKKKSCAPPAPLTPRRRRRVSFNDVRDVLAFPSENDDAQASQELAVVREVVISDPPIQAKKKKRSISFNKEAEVSTFDVFKDMTPTREICDELLLQQQDGEKNTGTTGVTADVPQSENTEAQKQAIGDDQSVSLDCVQELETGGEQCLLSAQKPTARAKQVTFEEEPEVLLLYAGVEETSYPDAQIEEDVSKDLDFPNTQRYVLDVRGDKRRVQRQEEGDDLSRKLLTVVPALQRFLSVAKASLDAHIHTTAASAQAAIDAKMTSISEALALHEA
mmetsp:Transcript_61735/g.97483  ORF Transcript_61735/g.97483 Transcript_61735/m.97483 type:complete len:361 (-) Transcript_61735:455-1537(-)